MMSNVFLASPPIITTSTCIGLMICDLYCISISVTLATINALSSIAGTRAQVFFTIAKLIALAIVIIGGIVKLGQGNTQNFKNAFEGTSTDPGLISLAVLDGYFAYKGW